MEKNFIIDEFSNIVTLHDEPDFVKMREAGHFGAYGISIVPSSARPSEVFAQLKLSATKT